MNREKKRDAVSADLRQRAEERLAASAGDAAQPLSAEEAQRQLHELQVHQLELELQNEELVAARAELEAEAEKYADLYDFAPVSYLTLNAAGEIREANLTASTYLNVERARLIGRGLRGFLAAESRSAYDALLATVLGDGRRTTCEVALAAGEGPVRQARLEGVGGVPADPDGQRQCRVVIIDITRQKQTTEQLLESEKRYRAVVENQTEFIVRWKPNGTRVFVNEAYLRCFGLTYEQAIGSSFLPLVAEPDRPAIEAKISRLISGAVDVESEVHQCILPNGELAWQEWTDTAIRNELGQVIELQSVGRDITERKRAEDALRRARDELETRVRERTAELEVATEKAQSADRLKTLFLSTVSHELRTPLNSISGFTSVLLKELSGPLNDEQRKQMGLVKSSSEHLVALVNDILDLSRIEEGQIDLVAERFDLNAALRDWMHSLQPQFEATGLTLRYDLPNDPVPMTGDARRIGQIILNLLGNAVKFTATGHVEVSLEQTVDPAGGEAPGICVRVTDTGPGIPPEHLAAIFEPFTQLPSEGRQPKQGSGLGLSISRKLATQMGGTLTVTSEVGHGSTFTLAVPRDGASTVVI